MFANDSRKSRVLLGLVCLPIALMTMIGCGFGGQPRSLAVVSHAADGSPNARAVSAPFEAPGILRIVAKFSSASGNEGVGGSIVPVARRDEPIRLLAREHPFVLSPSSPEETVAGVHGRVVVVVAYPGYKSWTILVRSGE